MRQDKAERHKAGRRSRHVDRPWPRGAEAIRACRPLLLPYLVRGGVPGWRSSSSLGGGLPPHEPKPTAPCWGCILAVCAWQSRRCECGGRYDCGGCRQAGLGVLWAKTRVKGCRPGINLQSGNGLTPRLSPGNSRDRSLDTIAHTLRQWLPRFGPVAAALVEQSPCGETLDPSEPAGTTLATGAPGGPHNQPSRARRVRRRRSGDMVDLEQASTVLAWAMIATGVPVFISLYIGITAPYGRSVDESGGGNSRRWSMQRQRPTSMCWVHMPPLVSHHCLRSEHRCRLAVPTSSRSDLCCDKSC